MSFLSLLHRLSLLSPSGPEATHDLAVGLLRRCPSMVPETHFPGHFGVRVLGLDFPVPLGLAAGFDKNALCFPAFLRGGYGFVEVGAVTPQPQAGNPKPRLFRLDRDEAIVNRLGFNNDGALRIAGRLAAARGRRGGIIAVNLGANAGSPDRMADYVDGVRRFSDLADLLVINVSSPNTRGLRDLQGQRALEELLRRLAPAREEGGYTPLLLKISPDLDRDGRRRLVDTAITHKVDGCIVSNTTVTRPPGLKERAATEKGGLSGRPLAPLALSSLRDIAGLSGGKLVLVASGGIFSGHDLYLRLRAGASLAQLYSAIVFRGIGVIREILDGLGELMRRDGHRRIGEIVGLDAGWPVRNGSGDE